jgi:hypothetical protein
MMDPAMSWVRAAGRLNALRRVDHLVNMRVGKALLVRTGRSGSTDHHLQTSAMRFPPAMALKCHLLLPDPELPRQCRPASPRR